MLKRAAIEAPSRHDFPFADGFSKYQDCYYTKDQFGTVRIVIGSMKADSILKSRTFYQIGTMPEGFRPYGQIYEIGYMSANPYLCLLYIGGNGQMSVMPLGADLQIGDNIGFVLSYTAYR